MRWLLPILVAAACGKPPDAACVPITVPQEDGIGRLATCREHEMKGAFRLCELERPLVPSTARPNRVESRPGLTMEECLRVWSETYDACPDQPDEQVRCALERASR